MKTGYYRKDCFDPDDIYVRFRAWTNLVQPISVTKGDDVIAVEAADDGGSVDIVDGAIVFYEVGHTFARVYIHVGGGGKMSCRQIKLSIISLNTNFLQCICTRRSL